MRSPSELPHLYRVEIDQRWNPHYADLPDDKPQGLYFALVKDEHSVSGWRDGNPYPTFERRARLAIPLDDPSVLHVEPVHPPGAPELVLDAGPAAFMQLNLDLLREVVRAIAFGTGVRGVETVRAVMTEAHPDVDWHRLQNAEQFVIAGGAVEARRGGYKAMLGSPLPWAQISEPEFVVLANGAIGEVKAGQTILAGQTGSVLTDRGAGLVRVWDRCLSSLVHDPRITPAAPRSTERTAPDLSSAPEPGATTDKDRRGRGTRIK